MARQPTAENPGRHPLLFPAAQYATPELQPAERLCPLANEGGANTPFDTLDGLAEKLDRRCTALTERPDLIKATTHFE